MHQILLNSGHVKNKHYGEVLTRKQRIGWKRRIDLRNAQVAPRAVISIGALISKRHPNIEQPPEDLKQADAVLIKELDEIVYSRGLDNRLSLNTILYAMGKDGDISDIYKYSHLARKYLGQFVLVEEVKKLKTFE